MPQGRAMRAVAVTPGRPGSARLAAVPLPRPRRGEALVRVLEVGIDGTDAEIDEGLYGEAPRGCPYLVIGHESVGEVERAAGGLHEGDLVVATVRRPCPQRCPNCRRGEQDMCRSGGYLERGIKGLHGYLAERYAERPEHLVRLPRRLRGAAVLLEPLSVVEKGVEQVWRIQRRMAWEPRTALVLGAGPIGLLAAMRLRLEGLEVHALDVVPPSSAKARCARSCGAGYVDGREARLAELPDRLGELDVVVEATGRSEVALEAMSILGRNGALCLMGVTCGTTRVEVAADDLNLQLVLGNKVVLGTVNAGRRHFEAGVRHLAAFGRRWPGLAERLTTRRVPLERFAEAFRKGPEDIKVAVDVAGAGGE